tara:strand:- start:90 stop:452 length:363 start_codon:yes stop_codon:yes gene_type:complete
MKKLTSIIVLSLSILLILGCGKVVEKSELNFRNGIYYPINSDKPYSGKIVSYYENGQLEYSKNYKNGQSEGLHKSWYENGQLKTSGNYKNGQREGLHKSWYENGQLKYSRNFKNGIRTFY